MIRVIAYDDEHDTNIHAAVKAKANNGNQPVDPQPAHDTLAQQGTFSPTTPTPELSEYFLPLAQIAVADNGGGEFAVYALDDGGCIWRLQGGRWMFGGAPTPADVPAWWTKGE